MLKLLKAVYRGGRVKRFHALDTLVVQNVAEHSFNVAWLCLALRPQASARLLKAALMHDLAEQETGDVPAPIKRALGVSADFEGMENNFLLEQGFEVEDLTVEEVHTLTLADKLDGLLHCLRELQLGNTALKVCAARYREYIASMHLTPEENEIVAHACMVYQIVGEH